MDLHWSHRSSSRIYTGCQVRLVEWLQSLYRCSIAPGNTRRGGVRACWTTGSRYAELRRDVSAQVDGDRRSREVCSNCCRRIHRDGQRICRADDVAAPSRKLIPRCGSRRKLQHRSGVVVSVGAVTLPCPVTERVSLYCAPKRNVNVAPAAAVSVRGFAVEPSAHCRKRPSHIS